MIDSSKLAFVFPGQGSQSMGMLAELAAAHAEVGQTFAEASERLGYDLWALVQEGPEEKLNNTRYTQPAMLASGIAVWRVWNAAGGVQPGVMAGHSLGEYSALVAAGVLDFADAIELVERRGALMQEAVPEGVGAMAAILGLDDDAVRDVCAACTSDDALVSAVNFNAPGQVVIAGNSEAVDKAVDAAKEAGAKRAVKLPVSVPSHCALMKPAADGLAVAMSELDFGTATIPVLHNVDAATHNSDETIRMALAEQLYQPVLWVDTINNMAAQGATHVVECGPGKVLTGLCKRIDRSLKNLALFSPETLAAVQESLNES